MTDSDTTDTVQTNCQQCSETVQTPYHGVSIRNWNADPAEEYVFCSIECLREWLVERSENDK